MHDIEIISFDCYGTLVDWKKGVLSSLLPLLEAYHLDVPGEEIFSLFSRADRGLTSGPYRSYREVLVEQMTLLGQWLHLNLHDNDLNCLVNSFHEWELFPDTRDALARLGSKYKLAVISNVDDDLFAYTLQKLQTGFEWIITASQVQSYKPAPAHFREALSRFEKPGKRILHVAQSIYHDIEPCNALGIRNAWINRYRDPCPAGPDSLPQLHFPDLDALAGYLLRKK